MIKKITLIIVTSCFLSLGFGDNHYPNTFTMEALQCKFTQGNDMDDAKRVIAQWKDNADKNFSVPYSAWVLTPLYTSSQDVEFDFAWLGFTSDAASMGRTQDEWQASGAESIGTKWERVTDCDGQALYGVIEARAPKNPSKEGQKGYLSVSSCSFKEGKTGLDLAENDKAWNAYDDLNGFEGGVWRWWPGAGSPTSFEHDFFLAISYSSMEDYGKDRDNNLAAMRAGTRPESILNCDAPRIYSSENVRLVSSE
tara:strand:+ start:752 stop:1510 length:759 start_codon:yes stop_codon:yes gene_type:complete